MALRKLLTLVVLLRLSTLITASIPAAFTQLKPSPSLSRLPPASVALNANTIPFRVPYTLVTLELYESPGDHLLQSDVNVGISEALANVFVFVQQTGDRPLSDDGADFTYGGVFIEVHPMQYKGRPPLLYADVVSVLRGISQVENQFGFATRYMDIFHMDKGYLGNASIRNAYGVGGRNATRTSTL